MMSKYTFSSILIICALAGVLLASNGNAQKASSVREVLVDIKVTNSNLSQVLTEIEAKTDFSFAYDKNDLNRNTTISLHYEQATVAEVLMELSKVSRLQFRQINNFINISKRKRKDIQPVEVVIDQQIDISGKVTDENGEGLPGASVLVKGTTVGTTTNLDGEYKLDTPEEAVLVISFVGYKTLEVTIAGRSTVDVQMELDAEQLDEIVVVGYGTQKKATLTGSAVTLDAKEIESIPTSQISNNIAGRVPGVQAITNSGLVGAPSSLNIRGTGTGALYVIDNIISDKSQFDVLDPAEIENISFLKDAATAAIYGARAAGGVVVVTTKSGTSGKVTFKYSNNFSSSSPTRPIQDYTAEQEIILANNNAIHNGNPAPYGADVLAWAKNVSFRDVNDEIFKDPTSQQHNLSVSGGSEDVTYFLSTGFNKASGTYENTNFNRYNFRAKVDAKVNKYLKIGTNISGNRRETDRFYWPYDWDNGEGFTVADFYRSTFNWSRLRPHYTKADGTPTTAKDPEGFPISTGGFNPVEIVNSDGYRRIVYNTFNANINMDLDIPGVKGLSVGVLGNYRQDTRNQKNFVLHNTSYKTQHVGTTGPDQFIPGAIDFSQTVVNNLARSFEGIDESVALSERYQFNTFLRYEKSFGEHSVNAMLGSEVSEISNKSLSGSASELLSRNIDQILATQGSSDRRSFNGGEGKTGRVSYFGRINYNYAEKYIAEFSFRNDGSYIFPEAGRFGFFPSVSAAWRVSEEDFFDISVINNLKIRMSLGTTGFDQVAPFQFQNNFEKGNSYLFEDGYFAGIRSPSTIPNPNITWETHETKNFGFDIGFWQDKLTLGFDIFKNNIRDVLASPVATIPRTFGANLPQTNVAERKVNGFEFIAEYRGNIGNDVKFKVGGNMGFAKNIWVKYPEAEGILDINSRIGRSNNPLVGYISKGLIRDQAVLDALPDGFTQFGRAPELGHILFEDINGTDFSEGPDGKVDSFDRQIISENTTPRVNYGISGGFSWKGFSLDVLFQGVGSYDKYVSTLNTTGGVFQIDSRPYFELWTDAWSADNPGGAYPKTQGWGRPELGHAASTFWARNGAYIRLKNVSLRYVVPTDMVARIGMESMSVFVNGNNLFIISGYDLHDPEQNTLDSFPIMKSVSGGISITF